MRRISLVLAVLAIHAFFSTTTSRAESTASAMADAASRFVAALDEKQAAQATFPFNSPERFNWHWIPRPRKGLPIKDLKSDQRALAFGLLDTGLSTAGVLKATTIMSLEEILRVDEHGTGPVRDPELYFVSIFGKPGNDGEWGWRVEGHHLSLNYTLRNGRIVSATPFQFGSNPAEVRSGPRKGLRNLADIEAPANKLLLSLTDDQRKAAIASDTAPEVTTTPNSAQPQGTSPEGISSEKLDPTQRQTLKTLVEVYLVNFPDPIRTNLLNEVNGSDRPIHFAWYGPADIKKPHAFRIQGPTYLIDFNDTQNDTNHIHTYFRNLLGDFGMVATH